MYIIIYCTNLTLLFPLLVAVVDVFGGAMSNGVKSVKLTIDEVGPMGDGDTAYERSRYNFYDASGKEVDNGK